MAHARLTRCLRATCCATRAARATTLINNDHDHDAVANVVGGDANANANPNAKGGDDANNTKDVGAAEQARQERQSQQAGGGAHSTAG